MTTTDPVTTSSVGTGNRTYNDSSNDSCGGRPLVNVTVGAGPGAKGDKGDPGATGESAYQIALDNGFSGTEAEWLASLVGPQGEVGPTGPTGPAGPEGEVGPAGTDATVTSTTPIPTAAYPAATLGPVVDAALSSASEGALAAEITRATGVEAALTAKASGLSEDGSSYTGTVHGTLDPTIEYEGAPLGAKLDPLVQEVATALARTVNISDDGTAVLDGLNLSAGQVLGASGEDKTLGAIIPELQANTESNLTAIHGITQAVSKLSDDGSAYTGDVSTATVTIATDSSPTPITSGVGALIQEIVTDVGALGASDNMNLKIVTGSDDPGSPLPRILKSETSISYTDHSQRNNLLLSEKGARLTTESGPLVISSSEAPPTSITDEGIYGELRFDMNYMYRCIKGGVAGSAIWARFPIDSTWI